MRTFMIRGLVVEIEAPDFAQAEEMAERPEWWNEAVPGDDFRVECGACGEPADTCRCEEV